MMAQKLVVGSTVCRSRIRLARLQAQGMVGGGADEAKGAAAQAGDSAQGAVTDASGKAQGAAASAGEQAQGMAAEAGALWEGTVWFLCARQSWWPTTHVHRLRPRIVGA